MGIYIRFLKSNDTFVLRSADIGGSTFLYVVKEPLQHTGTCWDGDKGESLDERTCKGHHVSFLLSCGPAAEEVSFDRENSKRLTGILTGGGGGAGA